MAHRAGSPVQAARSNKSPVLDAKPAEDDNGPRRADGITGLCEFSFFALVFLLCLERLRWLTSVLRRRKCLRGDTRQPAANRSVRSFHVDFQSHGWNRYLCDTGYHSRVVWQCWSFTVYVGVWHGYCLRRHGRVSGVWNCHSPVRNYHQHKMKTTS